MSPECAHANDTEVLRLRPPCGRAPLRMTDYPIAAIILAAGASSRMGRNKMLIEIDGVPLVRRAVLRAR